MNDTIEKMFQEQVYEKLPEVVKARPQVQVEAPLMIYSRLFNGLIDNLEALADTSAMIAILENRKSGQLDAFAVEHNKTFYNYSHIAGLETHLDLMKRNAERRTNSKQLYNEFEMELTEAAKELSDKDREDAQRMYSFHKDEAALLAQPRDKLLQSMSERKEIVIETIRQAMDSLYLFLDDKPSIHLFVDFAYNVIRKRPEELTESLEHAKASYGRWLPEDEVAGQVEQERNRILKFTGAFAEELDAAVSVARWYIDSDSMQKRESLVEKGHRVLRKVYEIDEKFRKRRQNE